MPVYDTNVFSTGFENPGLGAYFVDPRVKYSDSVVHKGGKSMLLGVGQAYAVYPTVVFMNEGRSATYTAFAFRHVTGQTATERRINLCKICNANGVPGMYQNQNPGGYCGSVWWVNASGYVGGRATVGEATGRTNGGNGDLAYWDYQTGEYNRTVWSSLPVPENKWHWISIYTETNMSPYINSRGDIKYFYDAKTWAKLNGEYIGAAECQYHNPFWSDASLRQTIGPEPEYIVFQNSLGINTDLWIDNYVSSNVELPEGESLA